MNIRKILIIICILCCSFVSSAESLHSLLTYNCKSIELNESHGFSPSYDVPKSINSVKIQGNYIIINYNVADNHHTYTHDVKIDLSTCVLLKGTWDNSHHSSNTCMYELEFNSTKTNIIDNISWKVVNDVRRNKYEMGSFSILCNSEDLLNRIYETSLSLIEPYFPKYESSHEGIKQCFQKIQSTFKEYTVDSYDVHYANCGFNKDHKTTGISIQYKNGTINIKFRDSGSVNGGVEKFIPGSKEISFDLATTAFAHTYGRGICFLSEKGIKESNANNTRIKTYTGFCSDAIVCREIITNFIVLKKLIMETKFTGTLGIQQSTPPKPKTPQTPKVFNKIDL